MAFGEKNSTHLCGLDLFKLHCYFILYSNGTSFCSFLVVEVEVLMPRKVVSICTVCRGGGGVVYSSRITVKTLFHSLAVGQTI